MSDPGRVAELLFNIDRRVGFGTGFMPPSLLAWAEPRRIDDAADLMAAAVGMNGTFVGGELSSSSILYFTTTGGRTWKNITSRLPNTSHAITAIGANLGSPYVYVGTAAGSLFKSSNNGTTFTDITNDWFYGNRITAIAFAHPDLCWVGGHAGKLKYTDHSTWTDRTTQLTWGAGCNILTLSQKATNKLKIMVGGVLVAGPTGKLALMFDSAFTDRSSLIPSCIQYDTIGHSSVDDRFIIEGLDASTTRVYWTIDEGANGTEISDLADTGGVQFTAFHVILDTWIAVKTDGVIYRLVQDRDGDVRLADEITEIIGAASAFASAKALTYDPLLNRYFLCGTGYLYYTDDVTQVGAFLTKALPAGGAVIGQVQIAAAHSKQVLAASNNLVKTGPGRLVGFLITSVSNTAHDVVFFDNTSAAAPELVRVRVNTVTYGPNPISFTPAHPVEFTTGLYVSVGHGETRVLAVYL